MLHTAPAFLPIGLPFLPHQYHWSLIYSGFAISIVGGTIYAATHEASVKRSDECDWMGAVWGYVIPIVAAFALFPTHPEFGLVTLQIVALGDTAAHLGGVFVGGLRLPWNPQKTFAGLLSFIVIGTAAASYMYWGEAPAVHISTIVLVCLITAIVAGVAESLPSKTSDNLRIGTTALLMTVAATVWWIGIR
jgi:phytol kinase